MYKLRLHYIYTSQDDKITSVPVLRIPRVSVARSANRQRGRTGRLRLAAPAATRAFPRERGVADRPQVVAEARRQLVRARTDDRHDIGRGVAVTQHKTGGRRGRGLSPTRTLGGAAGRGRAPVSPAPPPRRREAPQELAQADKILCPSYRCSEPVHVGRDDGRRQQHLRGAVAPGSPSLGAR